MLSLEENARCDVVEKLPVYCNIALRYSSLRVASGQVNRRTREGLFSLDLFDLR
jgi:hypothetical protein